jgi:hypothetical protein
MEKLIKNLQQLGTDRVGYEYCNIILDKVKNYQEIEPIDMQVLTSRFQSIIKGYNKELYEDFEECNNNLQPEYCAEDEYEKVLN